MESSHDLRIGGCRVAALTALDCNGEIVSCTVELNIIAPLRQRMTPSHGRFSFKIRFVLTTVVSQRRREKLDPQSVVAIH
jgi:hypothetical protein